MRQVRSLGKKGEMLLQLSLGVVLNVGFTTNGMCVKKNTHAHLARKQATIE